MSATLAAWHHLSAAEAVEQLRSHADRGLAVDDVRRRLKEDGANVLPQPALRSAGRRFLAQFASPLIYLLLVGALISGGMGHGSDAAVILLVVIVNALIGAFQEGRAEQSMSALKRLSSLRCRVLRAGGEQLVESDGLVAGDILFLAPGDIICADARLIDAASLQVSEAAISGESLPVTKHTAALPMEMMLSDRTNMVFSGTHVISGRGRALVVATGPRSELGKVAEMTAQTQEPKTPLVLRLERFGRMLAAAALMILTLLLVLGLLRGLPFAEIMMIGISQMVSLVPEGLPVAMTIGLAVGMQRMARQGAIVRRLSAVETLGATTVICTDKTGTLTRNEMMVTDFLLPDLRRGTVTGCGYSPEGTLLVEDRRPAIGEDASLRALLEALVLCNDAQLLQPQDGEHRWRVVGDPTEAAFLALAAKGGCDPADVRRSSQRLGEIPFDAGAKMMATQVVSRGEASVIIKGAPEKVLDLCALAPDRRSQLNAIIEEFASHALRLLAVAKVANSDLDTAAGFEPFHGRAAFLGIVGEADPPREEAAAAVAECMAAGIRPVMLTGDHKATGLAVASALGIIRSGDMAIDGAELENMPEQDLRANLDRIAVFARVHPAQKLRVVEALQSRHHVVAMTGDGVNDAPALARADVGVAMGITGTEVAKEAAKIVVTDDNFATIVKAVAEGRLVYQNIRKVVLFLFATSLDEVLVLLLALVLGHPLPLAAVQILWINMVTEGTVTVNLIMEGPEGDEMARPPIPAGERLMTRKMFGRLSLMVSASVATVFGFYCWLLARNLPFALVQTETFTLLVTCQCFNVLNCQSAVRSAFHRKTLKNVWLVSGLLLSALLQMLVIFWPPLNQVFHTCPMPWTDGLLILLLGSVVLWVEEGRKALARRIAARHVA